MPVERYILSANKASAIPTSLVASVRLNIDDDEAPAPPPHKSVHPPRGRNTPLAHAGSKDTSRLEPQQLNPFGLAHHGNLILAGLLGLAGHRLVIRGNHEGSLLCDALARDESVSDECSLKLCARQ